MTTRSTREVLQGFQSAANGWYAPINCLNIVAPCILGYPANAPTFLDPTLTTLPLAAKSGYARNFVPGALANPMP